MGHERDVLNDDAEADVRKQRQGAYTAETPERRAAADVDQRDDPAGAPGEDETGT
jgi:hypothetical protein